MSLMLYSFANANNRMNEASTSLSWRRNVPSAILGSSNASIRRQGHLEIAVDQRFPRDQQRIKPQ